MPAGGIAHGREDRGHRGPNALKYDGVVPSFLLRLMLTSFEIDLNLHMTVIGRRTRLRLETVE